MMLQVTASGPTYFLCRHVHACKSGEQVVFLDLRRDKYLAISEADLIGVPLFSDLTLGNNDRSGATAVVEAMLSKRLLTESAKDGKIARFTAASQVSRTLLDDEFDRAPVTYTSALTFSRACFAAALLVGRLRARLATFEGIVLAWQRRKETMGRNLDDAAIEQARSLLSVFFFLRPFVYTAKDSCLFDSIAILEYLAIAGIYPTWVIGVHTNPFAAHSWVESGGAVFNGSVEYVRRFTPILAV